MPQPDFQPEDSGRDHRDDWPPTANEFGLRDVVILLHVSYRQNEPPTANPYFAALGRCIGRTMPQPDFQPEDSGRDKRDDWPPTAQPERTQKTPIVFHVIASVLPACYQSTHEAQTKHQTIGSARLIQAR